MISQMPILSSESKWSFVLEHKDRNAQYPGFLSTWCVLIVSVQI